MSQFQYYGHRVRDTKPVAPQGTSAYASTVADIQSAWNTMGKAKTAMRQAENRISGGELQDSYNLNGTDSVTSSYKIAVDRVPRYTIAEAVNNTDKGPVLDKYGRTSHMKSRSNRKTCRIDDKYKENMDVYPSRPRSPPRDRSNGLDEIPVRDSYKPRLSGDEIHRLYSVDTQLSDISSRPLPRKASGQSSVSLRSTNSNLTDSTAIRETDIRFLNETDVANKHVSEQRRTRDTPSLGMLTHVDVRVPSTYRSKYDVDAIQPISNKQSYGTADRTKLTTGASSSTNDSSGRTNTTYTMHDMLGSKKWKALKHMDQNTFALDKVRELIRQQRKNTFGQADGEAQPEPELPPRMRHYEQEPVKPRGTVAFQEDNSPPIRKVAQGPPAPTYKGFSETESKVAEYKMHRIVPDRSRRPRKERTSKPEVDHREEREKKPVPGKPVKPPRILAPKKPPSKYDKPSVISTTSWREGQKAILRELGPNKLIKRPKPDIDHNGQSAAINERSNEETSECSTGARQENGHIADLEKQLLSQEAQQVLVDMESDHSDPEDREEVDIKKKAMAVKRKHKPTEDESDKKMVKVRTYDTHSVRAYMAKQRAERKRKMNQEREAELHRQQQKRKQLDELYRKQKGTVAVKCKPEKKSKMEDSPLYANVDEAAFKHALNEDRLRISGRDLERQGLTASDPNDISSDSSTLTETSIAEGMQSAKTRAESEKASQKTEAKVSDKPDPVGHYPSATTSKHSNLGVAASDLISTFTRQQGMTTDELVSKYARQAEAIRNNYGARDADDQNSLSNSLPPREPVLPVDYSSKALPSSSGKRDRIRALQEMSSTLQNRLQQETKRLTEDRAGDRWAYPRFTTDPDKDFASRYDRITGAKQIYSVFNKDLPGVRNTKETAERIEEDLEQDEAAKKIQAVYRGHTVRQNLAWRVPQHKAVGLANIKLRDIDSMSDDSVLSGDSTLTEGESDVSSSKLGRGLGQVAYHVGDVGSKHCPFSRDFGRKSGSGLKPMKALYKWDKPKADPHSVINIFTRRHQKTGLSSKLTVDGIYEGRGDPAGERLYPFKQRDHYADLSSSMDSEQSLTERRDPRLAGVRPRSSLSDYKDDFTDVTSSHRAAPTGSCNDDLTQSTSYKRAGDSRSRSQASARAASLRSAGKGKSSTRNDRKDDSLDSSEKDDTLTLSVSIESEEEKLPKDEESLSLVPSSRVKQSAHNQSDLSDISSISEDDTHRLRYNRQTRPVTTAHGASRQGAIYGGAQMSPSCLSQRMTAELHLLDGVDESLRQLTDVDRTRSVSIAQQETVSLAQILKARQQAHSQDMAELRLKAQQESLEASQQLQQIKRDAIQDDRDAAKVGADAFKALHESTAKLVKSQEQAVKAAADSAHYYGQISALNPTATLQQQAAVQMATDTAAAAAAVAVTATLQQYKKEHDGASEERGTQYSQRQFSEYSLEGSPTKSDMSQSYTSDQFESSYSRSSLPAKQYHKSRDETSMVTEAITADDITCKERSTHASKEDFKKLTHSKLSDSSIATETGAAGPLSPGSKTDSIPEDLHSEKDSSMMFETSVTEDELNRSLKDVLPSEGQRKKIRKETSHTDIASITSDDLAIPDTSVLHSARRLSFEEDSFGKFTMEMVKQYMKEEETRAKHQGMLLKLRERALKEKTATELAWLEQQKQQVRDKGADDAYPQLNKRRRGLMLRLQQEKAEIKRLQEVNRAASRERQLLLMQSQEIARLRQSTQQVLAGLKEEKQKVVKWLRAVDLSGDFISSSSSIVSCYPPVDQVREKLKRTAVAAPAADSAVTASGHVSMEDELSLHLDDTTRTPSPSKEVRSDVDEESFSEERARPPSPSDAGAMLKLKKLKLDEKYLTKREQMLRDRRENVEELMAWNKELDDEENEIRDLEVQALAALYANKTHKDKKEKLSESKKPDTKEQTKSPRILLKLTPRSESIRTDTNATEVESPRIRTGRSTSGVSITEDIQTAPSSARSYNRTISDSSTVTETSEAKSSSIPEDLQSESQPDKSREGSDETVVNSTATVATEYSNETFESGTETGSKPQLQKPTSTVQQNGLPRITRGLEPRSPLSPTKPTRKGSESDTDNSFTHSETASDQSDVELRIRTLNDDLKRRKSEAERLKKEQKKLNRERLKQQEMTLKKQIEAYDSYIIQMKIEIERGALNEPSKTSARPQSEQSEAADAKLPDLGPQEIEAAVTEDQEDVDDIVVTPLGSTGQQLPVLETFDSPVSRVTTSTPENPPSLSEQIPFTPRDVTEITEDITGEAGTSRDDGNQSGHLNLKLTLEPVTGSEGARLMGSDARAITDRQPVDTARSLTEIPEEVYSDRTPRSDITENQEVQKIKSPRELEFTETENRSARSERSDRSHWSARSDCSRSQESYSDSFQTSSGSTATSTRRSAASEQKPTAEDNAEDTLCTTAEDITEMILEDNSTEDSEEDENDDDQPILRLELGKEEPRILEPTISREELQQEEDKSRSERTQTGESDRVPGENTVLDVLASAISPAKCPVDDAIDDVRGLSDSPVHTVTEPDISLEKAESNRPEKSFLELITTVDENGLLVDSSVDKVADKPSAGDVKLDENKSERVTEVAMENLLNDALTHMIDIHKRKLTVAPNDDVMASSHSSVDSSQSQKSLNSFPKLPEERPKSQRGHYEDEPQDKAIEDFLQRLMGDEPYICDDPIEAYKPPPPYPAAQGVTLNKDELKLDLNKLTEKICYEIPHEDDEIEELVSSAVDVFWELRRYGEPWDDVQPPPSYFSANAKSRSHNRSQMVFKRLLFDLTAEILTEMYKEENEDVPPPAWSKQKLPRHRYHRGKNPPTEHHILKPIVQGHVIKYLRQGCSDTSRVDTTTSKWPQRNKSDHVDLVLIQELREEEQDWVNYDDDELAVKLQLADTIFDSLLHETANIVGDIYTNRTASDS